MYEARIIGGYVAYEDKSKALDVSLAVQGRII